jgi:flagellar biosynthesis anti-sigma factor FlgM
MDIKKVGDYVSSTVQQNQGVNQKVATEDKAASLKNVGGAPDKLQLSKGYQEMVQTKKVLMTGDDVRADRVEQVRNQVENKTYEVQPDKVAEKMLDEMM